MSKVLYCGSFDPLTKGHMDVIKQTSDLFDDVVIAVMKNSSKKSAYFTIEERIQMIKELYKENNNIKVVTAEGATVDIALKYGCKAIVRGIRNASDYDYEAQLQQINKDISNNQVNTICVFANKDYQYFSSSVVKEVLGLGKDISKYVDPYIEEQLYLKKEKNNEKQ